MVSLLGSAGRGGLVMSMAGTGGWVMTGGGTRGAGGAAGGRSHRTSLVLVFQKYGYPLVVSMHSIHSARMMWDVFLVREVTGNFLQNIQP